MKKLFFTALVAIVAIGGAVAGSGKSFTTQAGPANGIICSITVACSPDQPIPCHIDPLDPTSAQLYEIDNQQPLGKCTVFLGYD